MSSVDNRIVRMEFDNKEFEKRVQTSLKTLANLKASLNFKEAVANLKNLSTELKGFSSGSTITKMSNGIETMANRFSVLGEVGATVLRRLTNSAITMGKSLWDNTLGQISSGGLQRALNLEQAQFQLEGLGVDWEDASNKYGKSLKEQINKAVEGTAYGLDAAAKAAGSLVASGIEAGSEEMQNALTGISGVAAMTNSSYEEIANIFTKIAGSGKITARELNQFAYKGVNVAAVLAKQLGTTEEAIRDIRANPTDFETFAKAMNDAFGEHATKANETYTGSLSNVKAALSRLGAEFQSPRLKSMIKINNALRYFINGIQKIGLQPVFSRFASGMDFLGEKVSKFIQNLSGFDKEGKKLEKSGMINLGKKVEEAMSKIDKNSNKYKKAWDILGNGVHTFGEGLSSIIKKYVFPNMVHGLEKTGDAAIKAASGFERFGLWIQNISKTMDGYFVKFPYENINTFNRNIQSIFGNIIELFSMFTKSAKNAFFEVFNRNWFFSTLSESIKWIQNFVVKVTSYFRKMTNDGEKIKNIFLGIFSIYKHEIRIIIRNIKIIASILFPILKPILAVVVSIGSAIGKLIFNVEQLLSKEKKISDTFLAPVGKALKSFVNELKTFGGYLAQPFKTFFSYFKKEGNKDFVDTINSIEERATSFFNKKLPKAALSIASAIVKITKYFRNFNAHVKEFSEKASEKIEELMSRTHSGFETIKNIFSNSVVDLSKSKEKLKDVFGEIGGSVAYGLSIAIKKIAELFSFKRGSGSGMISMIKKGFEIIKKIVIAGFNIIKNLFSKVKAPVNSFKETLKSFFNSIDWDNVLKILMSFARIFSTGTFGYFLINLSKGVKGLSTSFENSGIFNNISGVLTALRDGINRLTKETVTEKLKAIAKALAVLALSVWLLSRVDLERLIPAFSAVILLVGELVAAMVVLDKAFMKTGSTGEALKNVAFAQIFVGMAAAILIMTFALKNLSSINSDFKSWVGYLSIISFLAGIMIFIGKKSKEILPKKMMAFASGILIMSLAFTNISLMIGFISAIPEYRLVRGVVIIGLIYLMIKGIGKASRGIRPNKLMSFASGILIMSYAIGNISTLVALLGLIPIPILVQGLIVIAIITNILTGFATMSKFIKPTQIMSVASGFALIGFALSNISMVVMLLGLIPLPILLQGMIVLTLLSNILTGFALLAKGINGKNMMQVSTGMVILSGALTGFAIAMGVMAFVPWAGIAKGLITLAGALGLFIGTALLIDKLYLFTAIKSLANALFLLGAAALGIGAGIYLAIKGIETLLKLGPGGIALISTLGSLIIGAIPTILTAILNSILNFLANAMTKITKMAISYIISTIEGIAEAMPIIVGSLKKIVMAVIDMLIDIGKQIDLKQVLQLLGAFAIIAAMVAILVFIGKPERLKGAKSGLALMGVMVGALAIIFGVLVNFTDASNLIKACLGISAVILAIAGATVLLSKFAGSPATVGKGVLGFGIVATGILVTMFLIQGVIEAIKSMFSMDTNQIVDMLNDTVNILGLIGEAFGSFIGGIFKGTFSILPDIGTMLSEFSENAKPFFNSIKEFMSDKGVMESVKLLVETIFILTGANLLNSINNLISFGTNPLTVFAASIASLGDPLVEFSEKVKGIDTSSVKPAAEAIKMMAEAASKIPNTGGLLGAIVGENDLIQFDQNGKITGGFAFSMIGAAYACREFSKIEGLEKIDTSENGPIQKCADVITIMAEAANKIPNTGGLLGAIVGENDIDDFAKMLLAAGRYLGSFANMTGYKNLDLKAVQVCADTITIMANAAKDIPNTGGLLGAILGENDIDKFGAMITATGIHLGAFAAIPGIKNLDMDLTEKVATIVQMFARIAKEDIPNSGGIISWFTGDNRLDKFAKMLPSVGESMADFGEAAAKIPESVNLENVAAAVKTLAQTALILSTDDFMDAVTNLVSSIFNQNGTDSITKFESFITNLGENIIPALKDFYDIIVQNDIGSDLATRGQPVLDFIKALSTTITNPDSSFLDLFGDHTGNNIKSFSEGLKLLPDGLNDFVKRTKDIKEEDVKGGIAAVTKLSEMIPNIPKLPGVMQRVWGSGETDYAGYAHGLTAIGVGLYNFWNGIDYVDENGTHKHFNGVRGLSNANTSLMKEMAQVAVDLSNIVSNMKDVGNAKDKLTQFGSGLKSLSSDLGYIGMSEEVGIGDMTTYRWNQIVKMGEVASGLYQSFSGIMNDNTVAGNITTFGGTLSTFGSSIAAFSSDIEGVKLETVNAFSNTLLPAISKGIRSGEETMTEAMDVIMDGMKKSIEDHADAFMKAAKYVLYTNNNGNNFFNGLAGTESREKLRSAAVTIVNTVVGELNGHYDDFYDSGLMLVSGFSISLSENQYLATDAAKKLGTDTLKTFNNSLEEKSPSKATYKSGVYFVEGYVNAIKAMTYSASEATANMGYSSLDSMNEVLSGFANSDLTDNPNEIVITPVFDMSELYAGLAEMNNAINNGSTYKVAANVARRERTQREREANFKMEVESKDVVNEVTKLREEILGLKESMSHLQIVMDSGAVVGELAPGMDEELGRRADFYNRGR